MMERSVVSKKDVQALRKLHALEREIKELQDLFAEVGPDRLDLEREVVERVHAEFNEPDRERLRQAEVEAARLRYVIQRDGLRIERDRVSAGGGGAPSLLLEPDTFTSRLLKYIPAEVITLYVTLDAFIRSSEEVPLAIYWAVFVFGVLGTYLYLWRVQKVNKQIQLLISVGAYCVWVFTLGGPFKHLDWYDPVYGSLLLPIYTFLIPIVEA